MQFVASETTESFVSRTNALLVGSLISIGNVSANIAMAFLSPGGYLLGHIGSRMSEDFLGHKLEKCANLLCAEMPERVAIGEVLVSPIPDFDVRKLFFLIFRTRPTQRHCDMYVYIVSFNNHFQSKICKKTLSCLENVTGLPDYLLHYAFNNIHEKISRL